MGEPARPWSQQAKDFKHGIYRHFKHRDDDPYEFRVITLARHSEDREQELVIYQSLSHPDRIWARPLTMFLEEVDKPEYSYRGPRFTWLREE